MPSRVHRGSSDVGAGGIDRRVSDDATTLPPFQVTRSAIDQIEALGGSVRVDVEEGGCCGSTFTFARLASDYAHGDDENRYGCPGAWLIVGSRAARVLSGSTLDYSHKIKPPRFRVISNPNTPEVCSCRRSFGKPWPGPGQPDCRSYFPMSWDDDYQPPARWIPQAGYGQPTE